MRPAAFEVDGFGRQLLLDDANMPNLLSIPYMGYADPLGLYQSTRAFVLRPQSSGCVHTALHPPPSTSCEPPHAHAASTTCRAATGTAPMTATCALQKAVLRRGAAPLPR